jgi:hypothetical protein
MEIGTKVEIAQKYTPNIKGVIASAQITIQDEHEHNRKVYMVRLDNPFYNETGDVYVNYLPVHETNIVIN